MVYQLYCFLPPFWWKWKETSQVLAANIRYFTNTQFLVKLFQRILHYGYTPPHYLRCHYQDFWKPPYLIPFPAISGLFLERSRKILQCSWMCLIVLLWKQNIIFPHCWFYRHCMNIQPLITCPKLTIKTVEQGVKYVQS